MRRIKKIPVLTRFCWLSMTLEVLDELEVLQGTVYLFFLPDLAVLYFHVSEPSCFLEHGRLLPSVDCFTPTRIWDPTSSLANGNRGALWRGKVEWVTADRGVTSMNTSFHDETSKLITLNGKPLHWQ